MEQNLKLAVEPTRKWMLYRLRTTSLTEVHESVVLQPWVVSDDKNKTSLYPSNLYTSFEKRFDDANEPYLHVGTLDSKYIPNLVKRCEIAVSIQELFDFVDVVYSYLMQHHSLSRNCVAFANHLSEILHDHKNANRGVFGVDSAYTRLRAKYRPILYDKIVKEFQKDKYAVDVHSTVGSATLTLKDRIVFVLTNIHGKYNAMTPIHTMCIMTLFYFETIGEILFPFMFIFTLYLMQSIVSSPSVESGWLPLSYKPWNTQATFHVLQELSIVLSMTYMMFEVVYNLNALQSMLFMQLFWLNFLFIDREMSKRLSSRDLRFQGLVKPGIARLIRLNVYENTSRVLILATFLGIRDNLAIAIFIQLGTVVIYAWWKRKTVWFWSSLRYFTGNENPEFQLVYLTFLFGMTGLVFYNGYTISSDVPVSNLHLLSCWFYFGVSLRNYQKNSDAKVYYSLNVAKHMRGKVHEKHGVPKLYRYLQILSIMNRSVVAFLIFMLPLILFHTDFFSGLLVLTLSMFLQFVLLSLISDVRDILMSLVERAEKELHPELQHGNLIL